MWEAIAKILEMIGISKISENNHSAGAVISGIKDYASEDWSKKE